jgi:hypothetical protein
VFVTFCVALGVYGQEMKKGMQSEMKSEMGKTKPTEADKTAAIPSNGFLKRGAPIGNAKKISLAKVLANPQKYAGRNIRVEGVIVRSCKMEGCWAELAPKSDAKSIRVQMKDHSFFIPLNSAGAFARAEGMLEVKTLSKAEVDHLIEEDGAKFDNRNADGTVTTINFVATGIELTRKS